MRKYDIPRQQRLDTHVILIVATLALVAGRILSATSAEGDTAFQSANDRSRWCTVASLVEHGTYEIDQVIAIQTSDGRHPWDTIDKVRHVGDDGQLHFYSSKPTLMPTLVAGVYAVVNRCTGLRMTEHPIYVPRLILLLVNLPVFALLLVSMMLTIEMAGSTDFARRFVMIATCFGTLMTPFATSLNNHVIAAAAVSVTLAIYLYMSERLRDEIVGHSFSPGRIPWAVAGAAAAFTVANELPALSMFACWLVLFALLNRRSIAPFTSAALVVGLLMFATNFIAHGNWRTPYAHRGMGEAIETWTTPATGDLEAVPDSLRKAKTLATAESWSERPLRQGGFEIQARFAKPAVLVEQSDPSATGDPAAAAPGLETRLFHLTGLASASGDVWTLAPWDDWYDYPGSYWRETDRRGVDRGERSHLRYLFHATFGYRGLFSLTPIWILVPVAFWTGVRHGPFPTRALIAAIAASTIVCALFYLFRPEIDRNYGGVSVGLRWMVWFAPMWLFCISSDVGELGESWQGRLTAYLLLAASVITVALSLDSAWQHTWPARFAMFLGWLTE